MPEWLLKPIFDYLRGQWSMLRKAPLPFVACIVLGLILGFVAAHYRYDTIIAQKDERSGAQEERIREKDDLITEYRERLHLIPPSNAYSQLSNAELRQRASDLSAKLREAVMQAETETKQITDRWMQQVAAAHSPQEAEEIWHKSVSLEAKAYSRCMELYERNFRAEALLLRDQLLSRLPQATQSEPSATYEFPTNPIGLGMVAADLERFAKQLP